MKTPAVELAITKEEYDEFTEDALADRLHWTVGERDLKPKMLNGRRVDLSGQDTQ